MPTYCEACRKRVTSKQSDEEVVCRQCKKTYTLHSDCVNDRFRCQKCTQRSNTTPLKRFGKLVLFVLMLLCASYLPYALFLATRPPGFVEPNIIFRIVSSWVVSAIMIWLAQCCLGTVTAMPRYLYNLVYAEEE
jgi:hypothetical protein